MLVRTLDLCLLGVNGVPFVQSVTCAGILTGYQSICGTGGHKKGDSKRRRYYKRQDTVNERCDMEGEPV